jgi:hypothetical protein
VCRARSRATGWDRSTGARRRVGRLGASRGIAWVSTLSRVGWVPLRAARASMGRVAARVRALTGSTGLRVSSRRRSLRRVPRVSPRPRLGREAVRAGSRRRTAGAVGVRRVVGRVARVLLLLLLLRGVAVRGAGRTSRVLRVAGVVRGAAGSRRVAGVGPARGRAGTSVARRRASRGAVAVRGVEGVGGSGSTEPLQRRRAGGSKEVVERGEVLYRGGGGGWSSSGRLGGRGGRS